MDKFILRKIRVWQLFLPLLAIANLAYLSRDFLGWTLTLTFFLLVPGYLLLSCFRHEIKSRWEIVSFSCALSVLVLMVGGLLLNSLHVFGLAQPLVTRNIFIMLDGVTFILLALNKGKTLDLSTFHVQLSKEKAGMIFMLTLLPFLAASAAILLNNGGSNILMMILFALIAILFMLLIWRKDLKPLYPYAIATMGLSILFSNSLRGWFITGHDIQHEFQVFQAVSRSGFWNIKAHQGDPYNACLSITILPTIIAKLTTMSAPYVFKVIFQIIFACGLVPIYFLIKKFVDERRALIGAFIFISFPTFLNDMPFLNRQEIAFIFFGLLILITFLDMARRPKTALTILALGGLILSHYSSSYITLALLLLAWIFYKLLTLKKSVSNSPSLPLLSLPVIITALLLTFLWNSQITVSTSGLKQTLTQTVKSLVNHSSTRSDFVTYSLFAPSAQSPVEEFVNHVGTNNIDQVQYAAQQDLPVTGLGRTVSHIVSVESLNSIVHTLIAKVLQVLLLIGLIVVFLRQRKRALHKETYLYALSLSCLTLLALLTLLPQLSVDYSVTRLFQQTLIILGVPILIGTEFLLGFFGRFRVFAVASFFVLLFLYLSGFVPQILGGYPPQLPLNNAGPYYDFFYTHDNDIVAVNWLAGRDNSSSIFIDSTAATPFPEYPTQDRLVNTSLLGNNGYGYLYQDYTTVHRGVYRIFLDNNLIEYYDPSLTANRNLVYVNQGSHIYGN